MRRLNKKYWPYHIVCNNLNAMERVKWLKENVSERDVRCILAGNYHYYFKDKKDAVMFTLRWS